MENSWDPGRKTEMLAKKESRKYCMLILFSWKRTCSLRLRTTGDRAYLTCGGITLHLLGGMMC